MLPYGVNPNGIVPTTTPLEIEIPLAPNQTVVGLVITNRTDKDILVYDYVTTDKHAILIESPLARRLEFDVPKGTLNIKIIVQAIQTVVTGVVYIERE